MTSRLVYCYPVSETKPVKKETEMNAQTRTSLVKAIAIFTGMVIVFVALLVASTFVADAQAKFILASLGSSIFGSGLTFFLIRAIHLDDNKNLSEN
jgi:hypothetical protein